MLHAQICMTSPTFAVALFGNYRINFAVRLAICKTYK